jgi:hypothetical protein
LRILIAPGFGGSYGTAEKLEVDKLPIAIGLIMEDYCILMFTVPLKLVSL